MDAQSSQARQFSSEWDDDFRHATAKYLYGLVPDDDWRWQKALCIQESRLRPDAVSPAGAGGLCQLVDSAAADGGISSEERFDAKKNIKVSAWILRRGIRTWWERETRFQRLQLGMACYNAGCGNILKAQTYCNNGRNWPDIAPCLSAITGHNNARETLHYVATIPMWYRGLVINDG